MKSEFISIVAHQLRTPLSGIKWVVEILLEKTTNGESRKWVLKINELNERMIEIISDLLNAARIEEGRLGFEFKKIDLISLLQKIADEYKIKAEQKKIKFDYSNLPTAIAINADAEKLEIALSNLIENAVDYTPSGGVIKIEIQKNEELVLLKISDSGIGIPKEDFPRLFTKFFRSKNAISAKPAGTGIGLFVAKNIIQNHKGEVWAESELEKGSIFYVKLPLLSLSSA
jgi:signal transduction histidine kinase